jgi:putative ABC transport system permease protein
MPFYLAFKELWRNRGRYLLFSLVIALITILVLFIAALAGGLANANKQFIQKLNADLLVYQENVKLQVPSSRIGQDKLRSVRRIPGVQDAGLLGFSAGTVVFPDGKTPVDVSLVGVELGKPGNPPLISGAGLQTRLGEDVIIDQPLAQQAKLQLGDTLRLKTIQGADEKYFNLRIVGITDSRQYSFQPSLILPIQIWDRVRPQPSPPDANQEVIGNVIAVRLQNPADATNMTERITQQVSGIEAADKPSAIQAIPGYSAQQSTLNTQQFFTLLIGVLVVGGFFQIQTLQKVAQIGVLKAIGSPNRSVAMAALLQIIIVTVVGVSIGALGTLLLALGIPNNVPVLFAGPTVLAAISALLLIGPLGGLVSIRLAVKIDPLTAIGLSS